MESTTNDDESYSVEIQLTLPTITPAPPLIVQVSARHESMQYDYTATPIEPTSRQNLYVLELLRHHPHGLTTIEFAALGVADVRPRCRDLRKLHHPIKTVKHHPHDVGRYVLMTDKEAL